MSLFIRDGLSLPLSAVLGCPSDSVILKSGPLLGVIPQASIAERLGRQGVGWAQKLAEREVNNTAGSSVGSGRVAGMRRALTWFAPEPTVCILLKVPLTLYTKFQPNIPVVMEKKLILVV